MSYTYKNNADRTLVIPNVGIVAAGGTIESKKQLFNPNLEQVTTQAVAPEQTQTQETN